MNITIELTGQEGTHELNALAALIASLGGRALVGLTATPVRGETPAEITPGHSISDMQATGKLRQPGDDEGEPRHTDTSELDADVIDAAVLAGASDRDSAGLPWDARIHSASRATVADGTWRRRKNTPDATYDSVMAELTAGNAPTADEVPPPPTTDTTAPEPASTAPAAVAATTAADVPPPPTGPDLSTWPKFVQSVQSKDVPDSAKIYDALNKLASETFSVGKFLEMKDRPNDWAMFYDMVG